jgi:hypothetical protein
MPRIMVYFPILSATVKARVPNVLNVHTIIGISTQKALPIAAVVWCIYFYLFAKVGNSFPSQGGHAPGMLDQWSDQCIRKALCS